MWYADIQLMNIKYRAASHVEFDSSSFASLTTQTLHSLEMPVHKCRVRRDDTESDLLPAQYIAVNTVLLNACTPNTIYKVNKVILYADMNGFLYVSIERKFYPIRMLLPPLYTDIGTILILNGF